MPTQEHDAWINRAIGVKATAKSGGGKGVLDAFKKKFKAVKEVGEQVKEVYDQVKEIRDQVKEAEEAYELFDELLKEAREAKELCDKGDPEGITKARDFLVTVLEKASESETAGKIPGAQELLTVYAGAVRSTQIVEGKDPGSKFFEQYMQNAEASGDVKGALARAKQDLCESDRQLTEKEFDKKLAAYVKAHPDGKIAAAMGASPPPAEKPEATSGPQQPSRRSDAEVNLEIIDRQVEPLRQAWEVAKRDAELAARLPKIYDEEVRSKTGAVDDWGKKESEAAAAVKAAEDGLKRAMAPPEQHAGDAIVIRVPVPKAKEKLEKAKAAHDKAKADTARAKAELERAKASAQRARGDFPKAQAAAAAAEDAYQGSRLDWYRKAQQNAKLDLPEDLQAWMKRVHKG